MTITRLALAAAALAASTSMGLAQNAGSLNIYNWGNYTSPELIQKFEDETGISVTVTDYDSNDTALTRIRAGGHGFDIVVPSNNYMPIWVEAGLLQELDPEEIPNLANIAERWRDVEWDPGRKHSVPWQWGTTGVIVNTELYDGDINTSAIFLDPPDELKGRVNIVPEMTDIINMTVRYVGGQQCTDDRDVLRQARDKLVEAKQHWIAMDYGTVDQYVAGDMDAGVNWNGASMRARLQNDALAYGYPKEGYPVWMDSAAILTDAPNSENAKTFLNFVLEPENAAMISAFARYANGVEGSEEFMPEDMTTAPEIVVPAEHEAAGYFSVTCPDDVLRLYTQIWTELLR